MFADVAATNCVKELETGSEVSSSFFCALCRDG